MDSSRSSGLWSCQRRKMVSASRPGPARPRLDRRIGRRGGHHLGVRVALAIPPHEFGPTAEEIRRSVIPAGAPVHSATHAYLVFNRHNAAPIARNFFLPPHAELN